MIGDYGWIEVTFDDALRLRQVAHNDSKTGCMGSGTCLIEWWSKADPAESLVDPARFSRPPPEDVAAFDKPGIRRVDEVTGRQAVAGRRLLVGP